MAVKCHRCNRTFRTHNAWRQHVRDSYRHHECPECDYDGSTWEELLDHLRDEGCRTVCQGCDNGRGSHWENDDYEYWEHIDDDNVCTVCERHFSSPANLTAHKLTHRSADYDCLGCDREFTTYGGMIIHLESGTCESGVDHLDLNETAAGCHWWAEYLDSDYRWEMLSCDDLNESYGCKIYPFKCPTCATSFPKLSSLFQHVESPSCGQTLGNGAIRRLRKYLKRCHG